jgi:TRAP-type mannitol/chloroaromatic compound transport system permease small subunit
MIHILTDRIDEIEKKHGKFVAWVCFVSVFLAAWMLLTVLTWEPDKQTLVSYIAWQLRHVWYLLHRIW